MREPIRVGDVDPERGKGVGDRRFAAADAAGQSDDVRHGKYHRMSDRSPEQRDRAGDREIRAERRAECCGRGP